MTITLNMILDHISRYKYEIGENIDADASFRRVVLFTRTRPAFEEDCLYVCRLSDALLLPDEKLPVLLCVRDRIKDKHETKPRVDEMIIINENLELETFFREVQELFACISEWYRNMQEAIIRQQSVQDIITLSEPIIGNFISVSDSALSLIAYTQNITTDDPVSEYLIQHGYHSEETVRKFKKFKRFDTWLHADDIIINRDKAISKYEIVSKVFIFGDTYYTHVVMSCDHCELTEGVLDLFKLLVRILSYYIKRDWETDQNFNYAYNSLLIDLIDGTAQNRENIHNRAALVGIKPSEAYVVLLVAEDGKGTAAFPAHTAQHIAGMFSAVRPICVTTQLILFIQHRDISAFLDEEGIMEALNGYFRDNAMYAGVSESFDDLYDLRAAYEQARIALGESASPNARSPLWESGPRLSNIAHFNMYYLASLLDKSEDSKRVWKNSIYGKKLLSLFETDIEKGTNNLQILYTYLMSERRATDTANTLHMHRNNVVYRVNRIVEMLGMDLNDRQTRFNLLISFIMLGYMQEYRATE